jgi:hypothetical protein
MYKYFKVKVVEGIKCYRGEFTHEHREYMMAKCESDIITDCIRRYGKRLVSVDIEEVAEKRIKRNTPVYAVVNL